VRDRPEVDYERFLDLAAAGSVALSAGRPQTALPSLRQALALWHGEAGAGIRMTNRLARRLAGLNERHLLAQEDFLTALIETGDASGALAQVQSILAVETLRERLWRLLMRARFLTGDTDGALRAYQDLRGLLLLELGALPSTETERLRWTITKQDQEAVRAVGSDAGSGSDGQGVRLAWAAPETAVVRTVRARVPRNTSRTLRTRIRRIPRAGQVPGEC
jgi:DNA-binding SARP family transcriptional activator